MLIIIFGFNFACTVHFILASASFITTVNSSLRLFCLLISINRKYSGLGIVTKWNCCLLVNETINFKKYHYSSFFGKYFQATFLSIKINLIIFLMFIINLYLLAKSNYKLIRLLKSLMLNTLEANL